MTSQSPTSKITPEPPIRAPSPVPVDDAVLPFEVNALDLRGRLTRLGPALDEVLDRHDYPAPVGKLLGEAMVLTTLLGSSLKFEGRFILQTQTDGPVSFLIVDFQAPDRLRAYARFDAKRLKDGQDSGALLGKGHLAMTIDQVPDMSRYQGLVSLEGGSLEDAAHDGGTPRILVEFADSGTGIPESEVQRIFEPFYTHKRNGAGLGLAISYDIIERHGGTLSVSSSGNGTTFRVALPAALASSRQ